MFANLVLFHMIVTYSKSKCWSQNLKLYEIKTTEIPNLPKPLNPKSIQIPDLEMQKICVYFSNDTYLIKTLKQLKELKELDEKTKNYRI